MRTKTKMLANYVKKEEPQPCQQHYLCTEGKNTRLITRLYGEVVNVFEHDLQVQAARFN